jgi:hypothetical protein
MASRKNYRTSNRPHFTQADESSSVKLSSKVRLLERRTKANGPVTVTAQATMNTVRLAKLQAADGATVRLMAENFDRPAF